MKIQIIIPLIFFFSSIGAMLYFSVKKLPILAKIPKEELILDETFSNFIARKTKKAFDLCCSLLNYKRHTFKTLVFLEKFLRKVKVAFLKFENNINSLIHVVRNKHKKIGINHGIVRPAEQSAPAENPAPQDQNPSGESKKIDL
jgi:hypothetical protein